MVEAALLAALGVVLGAFGTLVGVGGGFLLVPILLFVYPDTPAQTITAMSLFVVFANAVSGSVAYWRQRRVDVLTGLIFAAATLPGAVVGAVVVGHISREVFNLIFAGALALIGLSLLLPRPQSVIRPPLRGRGVLRREVTDRTGTTYIYGYRIWQGVAISLGVGFVASLLGIGGGIVHVPVMAVVLHFPVHIATATSQFVLALMAGQASSVHFVTGTLGWNETLARAGIIAVGAIVGAQFGAAFSQRVQGVTIIRVLGVAMLLVSLRLAFTAG
ncbi:MAG: sulfite exporter TauE/SafE family protein [Dehalococcoidia bacterium]